MKDMFQHRISILKRLTNCPVCGSALLRLDGGALRGKVFFHCGSVFASSAGEPIVGELACPGPTAMAAMALNDEAMAASRIGAEKAGAA